MIAGTSRPNDFVVKRDGRDVGRVMQDRLGMSAGSALVWWWGTWTYPSVHGYAPTLEAALERVRQGATDDLPETDVDRRR
ncbi:hypothetical protein K7H20_17735 [Salipiger manganoxidans]|uniref:hypothetical protein n=1 Tax=Salipiger marinus TaxID=555512 RepID=UPI001E2C23E0|nr:hypothetical protein [Salipiger manganoxidans]MCD1619901.1 hypothetical protein [Salipiger manganoxidans]